LIEPEPFSGHGADLHAPGLTLKTNADCGADWLRPTSVICARVALCQETNGLLIMEKVVADSGRLSLHRRARETLGDNAKVSARGWFRAVSSLAAVLSVASRASGPDPERDARRLDAILISERQRALIPADGGIFIRPPIPGTPRLRHLGEWIDPSVLDEGQSRHARSGPLI